MNHKINDAYGANLIGQGKKVVFLISKNGFVAVLEEVAATTMITVEVQCVPCEQLSHDG